MSAASFRFTNNSDQKIKIAIAGIPQNWNQSKTKILQAMAKRLQQLISEKAPFNTGTYAQGWSVEPIKGNSIFVTNPEGKLYKILEFTGSSGGKIEAKNAKALHFTINGQDIFVKWANTKSFPAKPHVRPAINQFKRELKTIIFANLGETIPLFKSASSSHQSQYKSFRVKRVIQKKSGKKRLRAGGRFRSRTNIS